MTPTPPSRSAVPAGFTLVELMVTVAIATILAVIAIPAYTSQVQKSRRTEARTALLDLAQREERYMSTNSAYTNSPANLGYSGSWPIVVGNQYYQITVTTPTATTFQAQAQPINAQAPDSCGTFTIDNTGLEGVTGGTYTASTCWN